MACYFSRPDPTRLTDMSSHCIMKTIGMNDMKTLTFFSATLILALVVGCSEKSDSVETSGHVRGERSAANNKAVESSNLSGEFIFWERDKELLERFPGKREYERVVIRRNNNQYGIEYHGVEVEPDHDFVGFFVVAAEDVKVSKGGISFSIGDRYLFSAENAPSSLEQVSSLKGKKGALAGKSGDQVLMKGEFTDAGLRLECKSESSTFCYSSALEFRRTIPLSR